MTDGFLSMNEDETEQDGVSIPTGMAENAQAAAGFLKALGHQGRLMILCHLNEGEKSVTELEDLLSSRQAAVSQQLARLRMEDLVKYRRDGKTIYYSLADGKPKRMISLLHDMFCKADGNPIEAD